MEMLVAACGLVCGKCDAFIGTRNKDEALIQKTAEEWSKMNGVTITAAEVWCNGCMTEGGPKCGYCSDSCEIRACVVKKAFSSCADCSMYPCAKVKPLVQNVPATETMIEALKQF